MSSGTASLASGADPTQGVGGGTASVPVPALEEFDERGHRIQTDLRKGPAGDTSVPVPALKQFDELGHGIPRLGTDPTQGLGGGTAIVPVPALEQFDERGHRIPTDPR